MQDLNYELKQLCARNRDGSFATQDNRERILTLIANQLREMGFVNMRAQSLKPRHVEALVQRWLAEGLSAGTLKNRMAALRWWAEKIGKPNVVAKSNDVYGIPDRRYVTNVSKARELTSGDLAQVTDPYTRMSLRLQATFGLRRAESIKIRPGWADRGDTLVLKDSWAKGGRARDDPDPQCRATPRPRRGEAIRRQGQSDSGRAELRAAAAPLRVPVRSGGHPPGAWPPPSVRAGTLPGTHRVVGTGRRRTAIETADARAEADRSRGTAHHQHASSATSASRSRRFIVDGSSPSNVWVRVIRLIRARRLRFGRSSVQRAMRNVHRSGGLSPRETAIRSPSDSRSWYGSHSARATFDALGLNASSASATGPPGWSSTRSWKRCACGRTPGSSTAASRSTTPTSAASALAASLAGDRRTRSPSSPPCRHPGWSSPSSAVPGEQPHSAEEVAVFAAQHLATSATVVSDGLWCFRAAAIVGADHERIVTGGGKQSVTLPQFRAGNTLLGNLKTASRARTTRFASPSTAIAILPSSSTVSIAASTFARSSSVCCMQWWQPRRSAACRPRAGGRLSSV